MFKYYLVPTKENLQQFYYGFFIGWLLVLLFGTSGFIFGLILSGIRNWLIKVYVKKEEFNTKALICYTAPIFFIWLLSFLRNNL